MFYETLMRWNNALESAVVGWFASRGALWRILTWALIAYAALLTGSSKHEQSTLEDARLAREDAFRNAVSDRDARRFRLTEASQKRLAAAPDADYFRVVIVGASENFLVQSRGKKVKMDLTRGLAPQLERLLSGVTGVQPLIIDSSYPGTRFEDRYLLVNYATQLNPDMILVTTDFHNMQRVIRDENVDTSSIADSDGSFAGFAYNAITILSQGPARTLGALFDANVSSFASGFKHSIRPWVVDVVDIEFEGTFGQSPFDLEHEGIELDQFASQRVPVDTTARSPGYDAADHEQLFANDVPDLASVFEIVSAPATAQNIPVQIMVTPTPHYYNPDAAEKYRWIADAIDDFEARSQEAGYRVRVWNSGPERLVQREEFTDGMHFRSFRPLAARLLDVLLENGMLPEEWGQP